MLDNAYTMFDTTKLMFRKLKKETYQPPGVHICARVTAGQS